MARNKTLRALIQEGVDSGTTQRHIALTADVRPASVSQWITGQTLPDERHIPAIARALGVSAATVATAWWTGHWEREQERHKRERERLERVRQRLLERFGRA